MSWEQLLAIVKEAKAEAENPRPVSACPNDGEPLRSGPDGQMFCPFDGYRPDGTER